MKSYIHFFFLLLFLIASGIDAAAQQTEKITYILDFIKKNIDFSAKPYLFL